MNTVLLVGCGNIGFRHLQAICGLPEAANIVVVEPNESHHQRIREQFAASANSSHRFDLTREPSDARQQWDLVVVATPSFTRRGVVERVLLGHDVSLIILEKILFQSVEDIDAVGLLLERHGTKAFVNCGRRAFPGYQTIRQSLTGDQPLIIEVDGHDLGLASNAIHFLDLAEYLSSADLVSVGTDALDPGSRPGRHDGCVELFGTISAVLSDGSQLSVCSLEQSPVQVKVSIRGAGNAILIDELQRTISRNGDEMSPFAAKHVSETTEVYAEALGSGTCTLTPYSDSARQHRLYLRAVLQHLGLPVTDVQICPVS